MAKILANYGGLLAAAMGQTLLLALCGLFFACIIGLVVGLMRGGPADSALTRRCGATLPLAGEGKGFSQRPQKRGRPQKQASPRALLLVSPGTLPGSHHTCRWP